MFKKEDKLLKVIISKKCFTAVWLRWNVHSLKISKRSGLLFYSSLVDRNEADFIVEKAYLKIEPA